MKQEPYTRLESTDLRVKKGVVERLTSEADRSHPEECCGLLLGSDFIEIVHVAANVAADPGNRFEIDPQVLVNAQRAAREGGPQVLGYYHSHPRGPAQPSATDRALSTGDGKVWAIVAQGDVRFWRDDECGFSALSYRVVEV